MGVIIFQLALLSGGAVAPTGRSDAIAGQTGRASNAVLLGGNVGSSTGYLDGIAVRGGRLGESAINLSPAAIDQFKVQMSFFMPDQGPNPGLVNLTTKGGANNFHGEVFVSGCFCRAVTTRWRPLSGLRVKVWPILSRSDIHQPY